MQSESLGMPPDDVKADVRMMWLPIRRDIVSEIERRAAQRGHPLDVLSLAHELGDVRFAARFAPKDTKRPRWMGAFGSFVIVDGEKPALLGYSVHSVNTLRAVPRPPSWDADPIDWDRARSLPLLEKLVPLEGHSVAFTTKISPTLRIVDASKPPSPGSKRRNPRMREHDIARFVQARRPGLDRAQAYGTWLADQVFGADIASDQIRITGETTEPVRDSRSFRVLGLRLNGMLRVRDPGLLVRSMLHGVGRRRAYGLGFVAVA